MKRLIIRLPDGEVAPIPGNIPEEAASTARLAAERAITALVDAGLVDGAGLWLEGAEVIVVPADTPL